MPSKKVKNEELAFKNITQTAKATIKSGEHFKPTEPFNNRISKNTSKVLPQTEQTNGLNNKPINQNEPPINNINAGNGINFLPNLKSGSFAIRIKELDECCCADVPCISIVKEYCESSSLHGLRYITEDGRHWSERILWVLLCLCGFFLTVYFILPIWSKWIEKPTITTLDSTDHPVWSIDFPAVTVCPSNKVSKTKLDLLSRNEEPWSSMDKSVVYRLVEFLIRFKASPFLESSLTSTYSDLKDHVEAIGLANLTTLIGSLMPACSELMLKCWWQGRPYQCSEIFEMQKTNDGFCCSFNTVRLSENVDITVLKNILHVEDLNEVKDMQEGLEEFMPHHHKFNRDKSSFDHSFENINNKSEHKIRRLNSANHNRGLTIVLDSRSEDLSVTSDDFVGFKILVHNPKSYPEVEGNLMAVGASKEVFISVSASHTEGSKAILEFPFEGRSCLFSEERDFPKSEVTIFKEYTQENCMLECRAKLLLEKCGCLPYFYPRLDVILKDFGNQSTCGNWTSWQCLANSSEILDALYPFSNPTDSNLLTGGAFCHCPPACTRTTYSSSQSLADFPNQAGNIYRQLLDDSSFDSERIKDLSLVHVFFKDLKVFKYHTDELFSWENILASFGGLIGLCTGFSFLSAAEFVYFFTLRCSLPICRKKRRRDKVAMLNDSDLVVVKVEE